MAPRCAPSTAFGTMSPAGRRASPGDSEQATCASGFSTATDPSPGCSRFRLCLPHGPGGPARSDRSPARLRSPRVFCTGPLWGTNGRTSIPAVLCSGWASRASTLPCVVTGDSDTPGLDDVRQCDPRGRQRRMVVQTRGSHRLLSCTKWRAAAKRPGRIGASSISPLGRPAGLNRPGCCLFPSVGTPVPSSSPSVCISLVYQRANESLSVIACLMLTPGFVAA